VNGVDSKLRDDLERLGEDPPQLRGSAATALNGKVQGTKIYNDEYARVVCQR